jgi:hypothetical protein
VPGPEFLAPVQVRPAFRDHPRSGARTAARQRQAGQAQFREALLGDLPQASRRIPGHPGHPGRRHPRIGDLTAERNGQQPGQPVRRIGRGRGEDLQAAEPHLGRQRGLGHDREFLAERRGRAGDGRAQLGSRARGQHFRREMLLHLVRPGGGPARLVGAAEPGDHPAQLGQHLAFRGGQLDDVLLQRGPARLAVLPGDGELRVVQGGKLTRGQAAFRLQLQVPETRPPGQRAR